MLSKGNISTKKVKVDFSLEKLDISGLSSKATYQKIKEYVLDKFNLKVSSLNIAQIKDKCGIKERENYNIAKSESGAVKRCTQEKAIMDAFRYFALI